MAFDIRGKLHQVSETHQVSERFSKREFVVEIADGKYPQLVSFQATGDRIAQLDGLAVGDEVDVTFNLRGREWTSPKGEVKYFNTLDVWKVAPVPTSKPASRGGSHEPPTAPRDEFGFPDDIPFATCDMAFEPSPIAKLVR